MQVMSAGDSTHSNKLGGFITAELFAQQIQNMNISLSKAVKAPSRVAGVNPDGQQVFVVDKMEHLQQKQQIQMAVLQLMQFTGQQKVRVF